MFFLACALCIKMKQWPGFWPAGLDFDTRGLQCLDDRVKPGKQGQQGTQMFPRRQKSGADFSQLMFSDAADPSAKTTADLWPSLSHAHNKSSALHRATKPPSSPVRVADRSGGVRLLAAGPVPRSPTLLLKDKQSQPISESGRPRPLPSLSPTCTRDTHAHSFNVTLWCP